jgi:acyl carrier protein
MDKTEIMIQLETAYGIQISDADARRLKSVGDIITYVVTTVDKRDKSYAK